MNIANINKIYEFARKNMNYEEVSTLSTMLYSLQKRQKVVDINNELEALNRKCSWRSDYKPVEVPEL